MSAATFGLDLPVCSPDTIACWSLRCGQDQVDAIAGVSTNQIKLLADVRLQRHNSWLPSHKDFTQIRELLKERAALEKDYATKLQGLARKGHERRAKLMPSLVVGESPVKAWSDETLKRRWCDFWLLFHVPIESRPSTVDKAYTQLLTSFEQIAQDHHNLAASLTSKIAEELKGLEQRNEEKLSKVPQIIVIALDF
jgi:hypothetical protein